MADIPETAEALGERAPVRMTVSKAAPPAEQTLDVEYRRGHGKEIAVLEVNGKLFTNWTSVHVEQRAGDWFPTFSFECSEESPIPLRFDALQFVPGDVATVWLGGVKSVHGYITERHVAFDARSHGIKLIGVGQTFDLTSSSVPLEKTGSHDGKNWIQLASALSQHLNIKIVTKGAVDMTPFENIHTLPGAKISDELERYARMRSILIGSVATGGLLAIGEHEANPTGDVVEGYNILRANCVVRDEYLYRKIYTVGQANGSDKANGDPQNKQVAMETGTSTRNRILVTVADIADTMHGIQRRVMTEKRFTEGSKIEARITMQGWFKDNNRSDDIWKAGEYYTVTSPSLIMQDLVLGCQACIYEQNNSGTTTTLVMVDPAHMWGKFNYQRAAAMFRMQETEAQAQERISQTP
jgi:prophage tail gpP-like protein